ncbi:MAG: GDSL-type esterase/lipase family protein [Lachnospiraceae bacterium]
MKKLKAYAVIVSVVAILAIAGFLAVFFHGNYHNKALVKLGIREGEYWTDTRIAVSAWDNFLRKADYDADIVFFGDSITKNSDFRDYFPDKKIANLGFGGENLSLLSERISMVSAVSPEKVFVMSGINCLIEKESPEQCLEQYAAVLDKLAIAVPDARIYVQSILPIAAYYENRVCPNVQIAEINLQIEQLALDRGMQYVDLYSLYVKDGQLNPELSADGVHPDYPDGYDVWAKEIEKYIYE